MPSLPTAAMMTVPVDGSRCTAASNAIIVLSPAANPLNEALTK